MPGVEFTERFLLFFERQQKRGLMVNPPEKGTYGKKGVKYVNLVGWDIIDVDKVDKLWNMSGFK